MQLQRRRQAHANGDSPITASSINIIADPSPASSEQIHPLLMQLRCKRQAELHLGLPVPWLGPSGHTHTRSHRKGQSASPGCRRRLDGQPPMARTWCSVHDINAKVAFGTTPDAQAAAATGVVEADVYMGRLPHCGADEPIWEMH